MKYAFVTTALVALVTAHPPSILMEKREVACKAQPAGAGPRPPVDTASSFLQYPVYSDTANSAPTRLFNPDYYQSFSNLQAAVSQAHPAYLGYKTLQSYDVYACEAYCNSKKGCAAFNIFYERDPTVRPGPDCPNPSSTTNIKCSLFSNEIFTSDVTNKSQYREKFKVVIAGSNAYTKYKGGRIPDYCPPTYLSNKATHDIANYLGLTNYPDQTGIDASRCAAVCDSKPTCVFFDTYMETIDGVSQGQTCAYYSIAEQPSSATNTGQTRGSQTVRIWDSYSYALLSTGDCD